MTQNQTISQRLATRAADIGSDEDLLRTAHSAIEQLKAHLKAVLTAFGPCAPGCRNTTAPACRAQQFLAELEGKA